MATVIRNSVLPDSSAKQDFYNLVEQATVEDITGADFNSATVNGTQGTPSLRQLTTTEGGSTTAVATDDDRLSDDRTASGIRTETTVVAVSSATAPTAGMALIATSDTAASWQSVSGSIAIAGKGFISTWTTADKTLVVPGSSAGTAFPGQLKVGYQVVFGGVGNSMHIIGFVDPAGAYFTTDNEIEAEYTNTNVWWVYISPPNRPFNTVVTKSASYTALVSEAGSLFQVPTIAAPVIITLPTAKGFGVGNTLALKKLGSDGNPVGFAPNGTDTIDYLTAAELQTDGVLVSDRLSISQEGGVLLIVSDGATNWDVVAAYAHQGEVLQRQERRTSTIATLTTQMPAGGTVTNAPAITDGNEILNTPSEITFTPLTDSSIIRVHGILVGQSSTSSGLISVAVFNTSASNLLLGCAIDDISGKTVSPLAFDFTVTNWGAGTPAILAVRAGLTKHGATFYLNGVSSSIGILNGNVQSFIEIQEIAI